MSSILCPKCGHIATYDINLKLPTSPVPNLLRGHCVASPSEAQMIHDSISSVRLRITQLVDEMICLKDIFNELARKRDALESYIKIHLSLFAPVRSLPVEILSEIFLHLEDTATPDTTCKWCFRPPKLNKTPMLLGNVCSRWRAVALSTPSLWASFALTIGSDNLEHTTALAEMWLARAGVCSLSISLSSTSHCNDSMRPLMQAFLPYCERWYEVRLDLPTDFVYDWYPAKNCLPMLQTLFIGEKCGPNDVFALAPRLRHLYLACSSYPPSDFQLPWSQLQFCDMGYRRSYDSCLELLRLAPNLEECKICLLYDSHISHAPAQLSGVRRMQIYQHPICFLNKLLLPELRELFLVDDPYCGRMGNPPLLAQYPLELLSFDGCSVYDNEMIQILICCPSLVQLELRKTSVEAMTETFLTKFTYHRSSKNSRTPPVAPRLRTIKVDYYKLSDFDMLAFIDAIQSRVMLNGIGLGSGNTSVAKLETVEICVGDLGPHFKPGILPRLYQPRLYQLRDMGLEINLQDSDGYNYLR
jgi:hypothetical protein